MQRDRDGEFNQQIRALHQQVLSGDLTATEDLAGYLLFHLVRTLSRRHRQVSRDLIWDSVVDALLQFLERPKTFDSNRGVPLDVFLLGCATGRLVDKLRVERRRLAREKAFSEEFDEVFVELAPSAAILLFTIRSAKRPGTSAGRARAVRELSVSAKDQPPVFGLCARAFVQPRGTPAQMDRSAHLLKTVAALMRARLTSPRKGRPAERSQ